MIPALTQHWYYEEARNADDQIDPPGARDN